MPLRSSTAHAYSPLVRPISLVDLLDKESFGYAINIIDHTVEPMQKNAIVARQLVQYLQTVFKLAQQPQADN